MKYSYNWIQKHIVEKLPPVDSLKEKIIFHAFEIESVEEIMVEEEKDWIMDIKILPDRAADCLSHYGLAREICGLLNLSLKELSLYTIPENTIDFPIKIESPMCCRYIALQLNNIKVGESPSWLKDSLTNIGVKSINNIVDMTNYILFDCGQPIHAYDKDKIKDFVCVRPAYNNEATITLSGEEKSLSSDVLVIADAEGVLALAGIKGSKKAEISSNTKNIIFEIANFDAVSIRKSSRSLSIATDASKRFENNVSSTLVSTGAEMIMSLIQQITSGEVKGAHVYGSEIIESKKINFNTKEIENILGDYIGSEEINQVFNQYKYDFSEVNGNFEIIIPSERQDLKTVNDIADEIGRVLGYDLVKPKNLPEYIISKDSSNNSLYEKIRSAKEWMVERGYNEVMTYTFRNKGTEYVARAPKNKSALRNNLLDSLKESFDLNKINRPLLGVMQIKVFEIGTVFLKDKEEIHIAYIDEHEAVEMSIDEFISKNNIDVSELKSLSLDNQTFKSWSAYPFIVRDIAVWINGHPSEEENIELLKNIIRQFSLKYCVRPADMFDKFKKDNRLSLAFRLVFQGQSNTLTEEEVEEKLKILIKEINETNLFEIR